MDSPKQGNHEGRGDHWYYVKDGQTQGPVSRDFIQNRLRIGDLKYIDLVIRVGEAEWTILGAHPEFQDSIYRFEQPRDWNINLSWVVLRPKDRRSVIDSLENVDIHLMRQEGPFDTEAILSLLAAGQVAYSDFAWRPGFQKWTKIGQLPEFDRRKLQRRDSEMVMEIKKKWTDGALSVDESAISSQGLDDQSDLLKDQHLPNDGVRVDKLNEINHRDQVLQVKKNQVSPGTSGEEVAPYGTDGIDLTIPKSEKLGDGSFDLVGPGGEGEKFGASIRRQELERNEMDREMPPHQTPVGVDDPVAAMNLNQISDKMNDLSVSSYHTIQKGRRWSSTSTLFLILLLSVFVGVAYLLKGHQKQISDRSREVMAPIQSLVSRWFPKSRPQNEMSLEPKPSMSAVIGDEGKPSVQPRSPGDLEAEPNPVTAQREILSAVPSIAPAKDRVATVLKIIPLKLESSRPLIVLQTDLGIGERVSVQMTASSGEVLGVMNYSQVFELKRSPGEVLVIEPGRLPMGRYHLEARSSHLLAKEDVFVGKKDEAFAAQLLRHVKKIAPQQTYERRLLYYLSSKYSKHAMDLRRAAQSIKGSTKRWQAFYTKWNRHVEVDQEPVRVLLTTNQKQSLAFPEKLQEFQRQVDVLRDQGIKLNRLVLQKRKLASHMGSVPDLQDEFKKIKSNAIRLSGRTLISEGTN